MKSAGTFFTSMFLASGFPVMNGSKSSVLPPTTMEKQEWP
jgi:hypothetical protein